jgi:hypothetical protein
MEQGTFEAEISQSYGKYLIHHNALPADRQSAERVFLIRRYDAIR